MRPAGICQSHNLYSTVCGQVCMVYVDFKDLLMVATYSLPAIIRKITFDGIFC